MWNPLKQGAKLWRRRGARARLARKQQVGVWLGRWDRAIGRVWLELFSRPINRVNYNRAVRNHSRLMVLLKARLKAEQHERGGTTKTRQHE